MLVCHVGVEGCLVAPQFDADDLVVVEGRREHVVKAALVALGGGTDLTDGCNECIARARCRSGAASDEKHEFLRRQCGTKRSAHYGSTLYWHNESRPTSGGDTSTSIRAPRQKRSREAWSRVLDAGVDLLSERGYEGFTISAICDAAGVAPRFIYDRVDGKDDLFLAVYEHGLSRVRAGQSELKRDERWAALRPDELVRGAIGEIGARFRENAAFLRSVVLLSSSVVEVAQRGAAYRGEFEGQFVELLSRIMNDIRHEDAIAAMRYCFDTAFAAWVVRVAYGPEFSALELDDDQFDQHLRDLGVRYLLR